MPLLLHLHIDRFCFIFVQSFTAALFCCSVRICIVSKYCLFLQFQVEFTISPLPDLNEDDQLWCQFGEMRQQAEKYGDAVICLPPNQIPPTTKGQGKDTAEPHG